MGDILGADLLMNLSAPGSTQLPALESVTLDFPEFDDAGEIKGSGAPAPPPKLVPSAEEVGPTKSWDGIDAYNLKPIHTAPKMSEDALMKEKYEILRKFERLQKLGVPIRKRFTMDSPIDEMKMELEFIRKEKAMDATIKQFSEWFITGMSAMEWGSKNINMLKMFGLQLDGLSQSAQMNVGDFEEDFEELYELYGDKMRMHPLVRIPMRTCLMVYMVHLTNQMAMKAPNIQEILRQNPDIARQMANEAMKTQSQQFRQQAPPSMPPPVPQRSMPAPQPARQEQSNPLSGLMNFLGATQQPAPQNTNIMPQVQTKKVSMPTKSMPPPQMPSIISKPQTNTGAPIPQKSVGAEGGIANILSSIKSSSEKAPPKSVLKRTPTSTATKSPKNSVVIKL
jgi:hypothetical protein